MWWKTYLAFNICYFAAALLLALYKYVSLEDMFVGWAIGTFFSWFFLVWYYLLIQITRRRS